VIGFAGTSNASTITAGALENSNVDLSEEFAEMIVTQRGFQANARVITTADEMLNELVNMQQG
jgi:flagellar hook protein FlgE